MEMTINKEMGRAGGIFITSKATFLGQGKVQR